jgi:hypothetical protein
MMNEKPPKIPRNQRAKRKHVKEKGVHEHVYQPLPGEPFHGGVEHSRVFFWIVYQCYGKEYRGPLGRCDKPVKAEKEWGARGRP